MTNFNKWIRSRLPSTRKRGHTELRVEVVRSRIRSDDPYEELERYRAIVADAVELLSQSRCAVKSDHVKQAKALLQDLL